MDGSHWPGPDLDEAEMKNNVVLKYLASALTGLALTALAPSVLAATSGDNGSHDPSRMIACEGKVYVYSTGGGAKSSSDGLAWKSAGSPPWNRSLANNQGIWAPDGLFLNGKYLLFGSMWNDSKASALVLLSSPTLNPDSPSYAWKDEGVIVAGPAGVTHSVIDPAPVLDTDGSLYVVWGGGYPFDSKYDSIFLTRLDNTGHALTTDPAYKPPESPGYALEQGHKEGPYVHVHDGNYFLFYQTGGCCSGAASTYTIHVARATKITGPYTGDKTFYASKGSIHGPGHMGVYSQCGVERFTYHYYPDSGGSLIGENDLTWGADGWPTIGPEATTALKICDPVGGAGGSTGLAGGGGMPSSGGTAGSSSSGGTGGSSAAGETTIGGMINTAGTSTLGGSTSSSGTSSTIPLGGTESLPPEEPPATDAGCTCRVPSNPRGSSATALWLALAGTVLGAYRRRAR
jgi:arabinan endo-1,5-alpha-L-arabinosidase